MWYAILGRDVPNSLDLRKRVREAHLERLQTLLSEGRVLLAGPFPAVDNDDPGAAGFSGSLMVVDFPDLAQARAWAEADPYMTEGVFASVEVYPFKPVLP